MTHHTFDLVRGALVHYGYWAVAAALLLENAGVPVPGETVLLLASFLAYSERDLKLGWIVLVGTLAATVGDNLGYAIGNYGGRSLLERYRNVFRIRDTTLARGEGMFEQYGSVTILFSRFVFGMRVIAGPLAGVLRMPWKRFAAFNFLGAALWVSAISLAGYFFGGRWRLLMHYMKRFDMTLAAVFVVAMSIVWWRNRKARGSS
ncbi:MAG TPA: DedA family protein [Candidatus Sulfotelmatobacter sp.]|jgi:membrane protein DedA with SNARE-associated domain|nr:DedA family protein [Candidatus Sulfotelmatobacter sp.]